MPRLWLEAWRGGREDITINEYNQLLSFREIFPFLREIPDDLYFRLRTKEFCLPSKEMHVIASELETKLGQYVLTYNADLFDTAISPEQHLCAVLQGAKLSSEQVQLLSQYEQKTKERNVTLVVYKKPVSLAVMEETALYQYYREHHLL